MREESQDPLFVVLFGVFFFFPWNGINLSYQKSLCILWKCLALKLTKQRALSEQCVCITS